MNVYSQIGLITLVGLITKHGILILEFTNQLREAGEGHGRRAGRGGRRCACGPILMTTGAMVLGAVPLALAQRRRRRKPLADRLGHRRRHVVRHAPDAVRGAGRLQLSVALAP